MGKIDGTGTHSYLCDGASPGSPVLSDGHAIYTPGLSENWGGVSAYYSSDRLGNLWTPDGTTKNQLTYEDFTGFGSGAAGGLGSTPFGYGGGNGCQTDADTGLVLMGHRYYDTRIGRFISQDPAGDGDNWYAYAGNNPTNNIDPFGLQLEGSSAAGSPGYSGISAGAGVQAGVAARLFTGKGGSLSAGVSANGGYLVPTAVKQKDFSVGASASAGGSFFMTNANTMTETRNINKTLSFNIGLGVNFGISYSYGHGIGILSVNRLGTGYGISVSQYGTKTVTSSGIQHR